MVRRRTSPAPGVGIGQSSRRKSEGFGSQTGREARTMRLPWDMMVPPLLFFVIASVAKQSTPPQAVKWIASRSLSSGAHSRDPLARNDGKKFRQPDYAPPG